MNEIRRTLNFLASTGPHASTTVRRKDADDIMLQTGGTLMSHGILYHIKCDKVGPSVYNLTLERAN